MDCYLSKSRKFEDEVDLSNSFMAENTSTDVIVQSSFGFPFSKQQLISV